MFMTPPRAQADGFHHMLFDVFTASLLSAARSHSPSLTRGIRLFGGLQHGRTNYREDLICIMVQYSQLNIAQIRK